MSASSAMQQYRQDGKITGETKWDGTFVSVSWELNAESLSVETLSLIHI